MAWQTEIADVVQNGVLHSYLGGMHDLLANIHLPKALEDSQKGYVQPLSGHLIISGGVEAAAHNTTQQND